jgi:hypothetical protein
MTTTEKASARQADKYRLQSESNTLWRRYTSLMQLGETDEAYALLTIIEQLKVKIRELSREG